jgi:alpha-galactosidase
MSRICLAIKRTTDLKSIGLCHQIGFLNNHIPKMLNRPLDHLRLKVVGLNHFGFLIGLEDFDTGKDLLPAFNARCINYFDGKWNRFEFSDLTFEVYKRFGYFPHPGDNHLCEYIQFGDEYTTLGDLKDWITLMETLGNNSNTRIKRYYKKLKNGKGPYKRSEDGKLPERGLLRENPSGERAIPIIEAIITDQNSYESSVNIPNDGLINNLPQDLVVEGPVMVNKEGVRGVKIGNLPKNIAALLRIEASIQDVCVEAILKESRELAIACLAMDNKVGSIKMAESIFEEMSEIQKGYLPNFK